MREEKMELVTADDVKNALRTALCYITEVSTLDTVEEYLKECFTNGKFVPDTNYIQLVDIDRKNHGVDITVTLLDLTTREIIRVWSVYGIRTALTAETEAENIFDSIVEYIRQ